MLLTLLYDRSVSKDRQIHAMPFYQSLQTNHSCKPSMKDTNTMTSVKKLSTVDSSIPRICWENELWYLGNHLIIPRFSTLHEDLFCFAHDSLGHFGAKKSYASIRDCYYWPNMCKDLENAYVPACTECQRNKSRTMKVKGPLHPLPIPNVCSDSVCLDFVGPLPKDEGHNCILTLTDRLGSDIHLILTRTDMFATKLAAIFFNKWYCENGLSLELISD
jgi:hypothetical protein